MLGHDLPHDYTSKLLISSQSCHFVALVEVHGYGVTQAMATDNVVGGDMTLAEPCRVCSSALTGAQ